MPLPSLAGRGELAPEGAAVIIVLKADVQSDAPEARRLIELAESFPGVSTDVHQIQGTTRSK